jgi:hypothetical protein
MEVLFAQWGPLSEAVRVEMIVWRRSHPHATLTEIETALDACLHRLRAQMLMDLAHTSPLTDVAALPPAERPRCPQCQHPLQARGAKTRHLQTTGGQDLALTRSYATCPACGAGLFPPG